MAVTLDATLSGSTSNSYLTMVTAMQRPCNVMRLKRSKPIIKDVVVIRKDMVNMLSDLKMYWLSVLLSQL